jgi:hydrogenase maturation factor HypF (carbamoyltransferase family)
MAATEIRVRGRVQGVGFWPTVWRLASQLGLDGEVLNDGDGVLIRLQGSEARVEAMMARNVAVIRRYCTVMPEEERALTSAAAPILLLSADGPERLPEAVAPGLRTLGFMLPTTPMHLLLIEQFDRPLVMTSSNLSDEPQVTEDGDAGSCHNTRVISSIPPHSTTIARTWPSSANCSSTRRLHSPPTAIPNTCRPSWRASAHRRRACR